MTYAVKNLQKNLQELAMRLDMSSNQLLASEADCPGAWVLQHALTRTEAGAFFALSGHPGCVQVRDTQWLIKLAHSSPGYLSDDNEESVVTGVSDAILQKLSAGLNYVYQHQGATQIPSKMTATQLKGRSLDAEISEGTDRIRSQSFRKAGCRNHTSGITYGNAIHTVLQYVRFSECENVEAIRREVKRLEEERLISPEQAAMVDCCSLHAFFSTPLGKKIRESRDVLREFKFSLLEDAGKYYEEVNDEKIILQGVVDCALIEDDGIIVLDFKTDFVTKDTLPTVAQKYRSQVRAYADALARIYQKPVKSAQLYFFALNRYVDII